MKFVFQFFGYGRLALLGVVLFFCAILDLVGIIILFPYIELAIHPSEYVDTYHLQPYLDVLQVTSLRHFILLAGLGLIGFYTVKFAVVYALNSYQCKAVAGLTRRLTDALYARLISCRYSAFQQFPASQLVGVVYNNPMHATLCLTAVATIINDALFLVMLLLISVTISPFATVVALTALLLIGSLLQLTIVRRSHHLGLQQARIEDLKHKMAYATISAIKDIKVMGIESHILRENAELAKKLFSTTWKFNLLGSLPKAVIEYFILFGLCLSSMLFLSATRDATNLLPFIGVMIAAVMRILPSFTRMIGAINAFKFYRPFVAIIEDYYRKTEPYVVDVTECRMDFSRTLEAKDLSFSYGTTPVLSNVSVSIPKGHSIGIIGMSGSGKSTLLDLISGIQEKKSGRFFLDEVEIDPFHTNAIRRMLGYVPQSIALVDESIAFNVSFSREWDSAKLQSALKVANLADFVAQLPERERTTVGENGIRLSGGQRQRIGIARALYKDPEILIFDEATSAVDNITEQELTREIRGLAGVKTLIMVAHRLSTIRDCDRIYIIHHGRNAGAGTYAELMATNALFQEFHRQQTAEADLSADPQR